MVHSLVITGGSRGIGHATAQLFLKEGWRVVNLSRTPAKEKEVTNILVDLSNPNQVSEVMSSLQAAIKGSDKICLVHSAAYYKRDSIDQLFIDDLRKSLEVNIISAQKINQMVIPLMKPGSSILYIGSTLSEKAVPGSASYIISKHGLVGLMKATCQDLIEQKIHTCCISPGLVDTDLLKSMAPGSVDFLLKHVIIGKRLIEPIEIANIIYFCAMTDVMNGITIPANTGQVAE